MLIYDNIHGYIEISDLAKSIIDTSEFQRMRRINQTGGLKYVYPTASHTRFEHSVGTYFLSKELINNIKNNQPELKISERLVELTAIAGLCHDLGHVCFSHLFDDVFLEKGKHDYLGELMIHEKRSIFIFNYIVKTYDIPINESELKIINDMIYPINNSYDDWPNEYRIGKFILTIVSNEENSLDVDKFDYLKRDSNKTGLSLSIDYSRLLLQARVIDGKICYPTQILKEIYNLFFVRYQLYKQLYTHKAVKAVDLLIRDCLVELESEYNISGWILDPTKYKYLTDDIIYQFHINESNDKLQNLIIKLDSRQFYKLVYETNINVNNKNNYNIKFDNCELLDIKIGFVSGNKPNPLLNIWTFDSKNKNKCFKADFNKVMHLKPDNYQERFLRIYSKNANFNLDDEINVSKIIDEINGEKISTTVSL